MSGRLQEINKHVKALQAECIGSERLLSARASDSALLAENLLLFETKNISMVFRTRLN